MQNAEIELKFRVDNPALLQFRLPGLGFILETPRTFEQNSLYDTPLRSLRESKQLLRLRQYGDLWTLTHKRQAPPDQATDLARYKVRLETETHLDDGPALDIILKQLGYAPVFRYEKFRTEWAQPAELIATFPFDAETSSNVVDRPIAHLVVDETPIGDYAELEGPTEWIDRTLVALGVDPSTCLTDSYGKLFLEWKKDTGSSANNLTFAEIPSPLAMQQTLS